MPQRCPHWDAGELTAPGGEPGGLPGLEGLPGPGAASTGIANILYTSGTTGRPKGAMQTHGNLLFNAGTVGSVLGVTASDRTLVVAPMFHATGIVSQLVGFGAHGAACVFLPRFRPADMLAALIEHRITFFAGVTAMIQLMLADPGFDPADLPALRTACFGGAPVPEAFLDEAARRLPHVTFMNVWGLTEATSIVTCAVGSQWRKRPWSVGRPVPGVEVAVAVGGEIAGAPDAVGELWVRGPVVTAGYWNCPEATADAFGADGWLRTGDVGRADADGYVQVLDRMKDMIIRGGENIYSLEVEGVLARHPAIAEVAVVGVPDPVMGERVRAVAVLGAGQFLALGALREWASTQLADYKLPAELVTVGATPPQRQRQGHEEATGRAGTGRTRTGRTGRRRAAERNREHLMQTGWMPAQEEAAKADRVPAGRSMSDAILDSAATLFSRRGYHAIGIRELADSVGLSTSTLYHYYATKQDILYAVIGRFLREFVDTLVAGLHDMSVPPRARLERAVTDHVVLTVTRREELLAGNPVLNALTAEQQAGMAALRRSYRDAVRDVIAEGAAAGQFHVTDPLLTAMAMLDMLDGIRAWYHEDGALSLAELAARYRAFALSLCQAGET